MRSIPLTICLLTGFLASSAQAQFYEPRVLETVELFPSVADQVAPEAPPYELPARHRNEWDLTQGEIDRGELSRPGGGQMIERRAVPYDVFKGPLVVESEYGVIPMDDYYGEVIKEYQPEKAVLEVEACVWDTTVLYWDP